MSYKKIVTRIMAKVFIVTTPIQPQLNSKVGCAMKMTLHNHHQQQQPPQIQCHHISAVPDPILTKL